jgi:hypothetical protein
MQISPEDLARMSPEEFAALEFEDARELVLVKLADGLRGVGRVSASASVAKQNFKMLVEYRGIDFAKAARCERRRLEFENGMMINPLPPDTPSELQDAARRIPRGSLQRSGCLEGHRQVLARN